VVRKSKLSSAKGTAPLSQRNLGERNLPVQMQSKKWHFFDWTDVMKNTVEAKTWNL